MKKPAGVPTHGHMGCCPPDWRDVPDVSGSYELDGVIQQSKNNDVPARLSLYCGRPNAYGPVTAYNGYENYGGDK